MPDRKYPERRLYFLQPMNQLQKNQRERLWQYVLQKDRMEKMNKRHSIRMSKMCSIKMIILLHLYYFIIFITTQKKIGLLIFYFYVKLYIFKLRLLFVSIHLLNMYFHSSVHLMSILDVYFHSPVSDRYMRNARKTDFNLKQELFNPKFFLEFLNPN